ncbi:hypothetical protein LCGC14_1901230, partial [marine sediment metagenome]
HAPCGLIRHAKLTLQFLAGHAMLGRGEQKDRVEPKLQRSAALFKDTANHWVNVVAAPLAGISLLIGQAIPFGVTLTLWAGMALTEADVEQMLKASLVGGELFEELAEVCLFHAL